VASARAIAAGVVSACAAPVAAVAAEAKRKSVLSLVLLWLVVVCLIAYFFIGPAFVDRVNANASDSDRKTSQGALAVSSAFFYALIVTIVSYWNERRTGDPLPLDIPPSWNPWLSAGLAILIAVVIALNFDR
jgi:di/tricarboxylate transporter